MKLEFIIRGEPASKANSRKLVRLGGRPAFIKSAKARDYEAMALMQIPAAVRVMLAVPVRVKMEIFYRTQRPDLDESVILDVMQKAGVYANDRLVREKHITHGIDRENPRAIITVEELRAAHFPPETPSPSPASCPT